MATYLGVNGVAKAVANSYVSIYPYKAFIYSGYGQRSNNYYYPLESLYPATWIGADSVVGGSFPSGSTYNSLTQRNVSII